MVEGRYLGRARFVAWLGLVKASGCGQSSVVALSEEVEGDPIIVS
jgi:hypothetical protein